MQEKKLDEIQEGMLTGETISCSEGRILIARGDVLTGEKIDELKAKNIQSVYVEDDLFLVEKFKHINERVEAKFKEFSDNPVMQHIASLAKSYLKCRFEKGLK